MTTRQYARLLSEWIASIGLDPELFGTHSLRRTKATLIYRRKGNLRAAQLLLESETVMLAADGCVFEILTIAIGRNPKAPVDQIGSFESIRGQARTPALARVD
jgi:hypothetical protein